jgi:hypothetical protein
MQSQPKTSLWMAGAFSAAICLAGAMLVTFGTGLEGISAALAATARLGFMFFLPAYAGSSMVALFGPAFLPLKRYGRELGLAFISVLTVHLSLVTWLCLIGEAPGRSTFILFGIGVICAYAIALLSLGGLRKAVGPGVWWLVRVLGMNYILYAFAIDFLNSPLHGSAWHIALYLPFASLALVAPVLRIAAAIRRADHLLRHSPYRPNDRRKVTS